MVVVDGHELWRGEMRTGDTRALDLIAGFHLEARIRLWEHDAAHSDFIGDHTVSQALRGAGPQEHTFSRCRGIPGDATYRLRYQVE